MKRIYAADLFCGAGGTSTGLLKAAKQIGLNVQLIAVNHWDVAIATHSLNHPNVNHYQSDLEKMDPRKVVPGGKLRLLVASPECTHFSKARGGMPMSKQSRASVKYILRWVGALDIENVLIENVAEFEDWGPLHRKGPDINKPIKSRKGEYFHRFIRKMQEYGYQVRWRVLNAADYGDPTTRKRLFVMACKSRTPVFPEPSHAKIATDMFGTRPTWRPARDIIDWTIKGESIFARKRPLAPNTMRRIMAGLKKFGGKAFVLGQQSGAAPRGVDQPLPTIAGDGAISVIDPFIVEYHGGKHGDNRTRSINEPLPTQTTENRFGLAQPFIIPFFGEREGQEPRTHSVDEPLQTITSHGAGALVEPFLVMLNGTDEKSLEKSNRSVDQPLPTVTGTPHMGLVEPFIMPVNHGKDTRTHSLDNPMPTVTSVDAWALIEPFIVPQFSSGAPRSVDEPLSTITSTSRGIGLAEPYLVEYYGTGSASSVDEPLKTQTGRDRFGLVQPMIFQHEGRKYLLDIRFRMLQPHELARAMSFPKSYKFSGNREQVVKQIGNAVPVELAAALCREQLRPR